jgi:hypothetical protein
VAVTDVDEAGAQAVAAELDGAAAFRLDVTDRASIETACEAACGTFGPLSV